jgi:nicotinamidase/pyrazinamidase
VAGPLRAGDRGSGLSPGLAVRHAELVLRKGFRPEIDSYSAFRENDRRTPTGLAAYLRERGFERLTLRGLAPDYCVLFSVLEAREAGFAVQLAASACRGIDLDGSLARAMRSMTESGVTVRD